MRTRFGPLPNVLAFLLLFCLGGAGSLPLRAEGDRISLSFHRVEVVDIAKVMAAKFERPVVCFPSTLGPASIEGKDLDETAARQQLTLSANVACELHQGWWVVVAPGEADALRARLAACQPLPGLDGKVSLDFRASPATKVLAVLARSAKLAIRFPKDLPHRVTVRATDRPLGEVLAMIGAATGLGVRQDGGFLIVEGSVDLPAGSGAAPADPAGEDVSPQPVPASFPAPALTPAAGPPPPPPPPLRLKLIGVLGDDESRAALIVWEGKTLTVRRDNEVEGKFKVVDILPDKIVVYSRKEQMRRTFSLQQP
ncbi:MAG: hypothetical protein GX442_01915 [Candidatus Riflebacteria bacterium]|nr:hypothetical protein [Candidatus Riflebacteria bacterium]